MPLVDPNSGTVLGEICHIKARSPDGPRYDPAQTDEERHSSENLLLLCPSHHKIVDDNPEEYITERLLEIKSQHEAKHAGGQEASDEVARQFLIRIGYMVHGDKVSGGKISVGDVGDGAVVTILTGAPTDEKTGRTPAPAVAPIGPPHRDISRLSTEVDFQLFGRDQDLKALDEAWSSSQARLLSLFACGGMGKTALVNHWLRKHKDEEQWQGIGLVFAYTFHSDPSDSFFDETLRFLRVSCDAHSPEERAIALAEAIAAGADDQQRWLLVLDGIERVLSDPSVHLLLRRLADSPAPGLCITTSRLPLKEAFAYLGPPFVERELLPLDESAGAELLQHMLADLPGHVVQDDKLHRVSHEFKGHPLTLRLIGGFLERDFRGDILPINLPLRGLGLDEEQAVHKMLDWYEESAYEDGLEKDRLERDILNYLGVFDVPTVIRWCAPTLRPDIRDGINENGYPCIRIFSSSSAPQQSRSRKAWREWNPCIGRCTTAARQKSGRTLCASLWRGFGVTNNTIAFSVWGRWYPICRPCPGSLSSLGLPWVRGYPMPR